MSKTTGQSVIVGIPAYNEARYIGSVVLQARRFAREVIVVDDGSTDRTAEIALSAGATVARHDTNKGYGASIQTILVEAKRREPDVLVILDGDGQHDPSETPKMVQAVLEGSDLVLGSRRLEAGKIPRLRRVGQGVLSYFARVLSKTRIEDSQCGFRAYSRKALMTLDPKENGMAISTEIISEASRKGLKLAEVPVSAIYTEDGSSQNPVRHGFGVLGRTVDMISERRPLLFFGVSGFALCILGIVAGVRVLSAMSRTGAFPIGTALLCAVFLIVGVFSIFTGIVLNILTRKR